MDGERKEWLTTKQRIIGAAVVLVVVAVVLAVINSAIKTHKTSHASFAGVTKLDVSVGAGSLRLLASSGNSIEVDKKTSYLLNGPSISEKIKGDTLVIRQNCSGVHIGECTTAYSISVPGNVDTTASGGAPITADSLQGKLTATTSGAKVAVSKSFGDLVIKTDSGSVEATDLSALRAQVQTKGGKIALGFSTAPLQVGAQSNDGTVGIQIPKSNTAFNVDATSSNAKSTVDVKVDASSPRSITAHSTNGKVSVEHD